MHPSRPLGSWRLTVQYIEPSAADTRLFLSWQVCLISLPPSRVEHSVSAQLFAHSYSKTSADLKNKYVRKILNLTSKWHLITRLLWIIVIIFVIWQFYYRLCGLHFTQYLHSVPTCEIGSWHVAFLVWWHVVCSHHWKGKMENLYYGYTDCYEKAAFAYDFHTPVAHLSFGFFLPDNHDVMKIFVLLSASQAFQNELHFFNQWNTLHFVFYSFEFFKK